MVIIIIIITLSHTRALDLFVSSSFGSIGTAKGIIIIISLSHLTATHLPSSIFHREERRETTSPPIQLYVVKVACNEWYATNKHRHTHITYTHTHIKRDII